MATYKLIEAKVLGTSAAYVEFTGLGSYSSDYTDLELVYTTRLVGGGVANTDLISLNGSTSNFSNKVIQGNGSSVSSYASAREIGLNNGNSSTGSTYASSKIYFPNFSSSNYKSYSVDSVTENNGSTAYTQLVAGLWSNTAAITSIRITPDTSSYTDGSSFYLYGISNA